MLFRSNDTATTEIYTVYNTLSLHDALPICDLDGEGMRTQMVVALDSESRVRDGDKASLWFDPTKMMVFDPEGGENLTYDADKVREVDQQNEQDRKASIQRAQERESAKAS